jgi:hypothetical protein
MATPFGVKRPKAGDAAPTQNVVARVGMFESKRVGTKVESGRGPYAALEIAAKGFVMLV